jgi:hypothetical protein
VRGGVGGLLPPAQLRSDGRPVTGSLCLIWGVIFRSNEFPDGETTARRHPSLQTETVRVSRPGQTSNAQEVLSVKCRQRRTSEIDVRQCWECCLEQPIAKSIHLLDNLAVAHLPGKFAATPTVDCGAVHAVEAYRVVRCWGSHIVLTIGSQQGSQP